MPAFLRFESVRNLWTHWLEHHQHPASRVLHAIGVPLLLLAGIVAIAQLIDGRWDLWWRPALLLVISYLMQGIGHAVEGSEMGEVLLLRKVVAKARGHRQ